MTLLREIQDAAIDSGVSLPDMLRRCKILAARLENEDFKAWVDKELNGYDNDDELPGYRVLSVQSKATFSGPFGSGLENVPVPPSTIPKKFRHHVDTARFTQPISALVELAAAGAGEVIHSAWPADLLVLVGQNIIEDMSCLQAYKEISRASVAGIVDTVRTRVLDFVLELESLDPEAGEEIGSSNIEPDRIDQLIQTNIYGNVTNLAAGSRNTTQVGELHIHEGDFESLDRYLQQLGVEPKDIEELATALEEDEADAAESGLGKRVASWIGTMIKKAASGAWEVGTTVAGSVLTKAVLRYLGLDN